MCTLTNSEDLYEMPHYAAFHQDLHCLLSMPVSKNDFMYAIAISSTVS